MCTLEKLCVLLVQTELVRTPLSLNPQVTERMLHVTSCHQPQSSSLKIKKKKVKYLSMGLRGRLEISMQGRYYLSS